MDNEEIKQTQEQYKGLLAELDSVSGKMTEFSALLQEISEEFENGSTVSTDLFGRMMRMAQDYYTIDMRLKSSLPETDKEAGYSISSKKAMLNEKLELLDRELIKNSVDTYFNLHIADAERAAEMEETKADLHAILENPSGIDMDAIRPYMSILKIVDDPDVELSDELMDEMDDTFSKPFMRAVLRGKVTHLSAEGDSASKHAQTLE